MKLFQFAVLTLVCLGSQAFSSPLDVETGEYANYLDSRGAMHFYRGYAVFPITNGHDGVFIRNRDLTTGRQINYYAELAYDQENTPSLVSVKGMKDSDPPEFRQGLVDFMNFTAIYGKNKGRLDGPLSVEDPWEDYTLVYSFRPLLPLFRFESITVKGQPKVCYQLESSGIVKSDELASFFKMEPEEFPPKARGITNLTIPPASPKTVEINGLKTTLDQNWQARDLNGSPSYWLALATPRDSQVTVEKLSLEFLKSKGLTLEELCRLNIIGSKKLLFGSVYKSVQNGCLEVGYALLDDEGQKNYQIFVAKQKGDFYYIVNFSSFADIFDANVDYYKSIVRTLENQL